MSIPKNLEKSIHVDTDLLACPICLQMFEGRILQCSQGHAVCEKCHSRLTDCPQCRCCFVGTRNYSLEAVIAKMKQNEILNVLTKQQTSRSGIGVPPSSSHLDDNSSEPQTPPSRLLEAPLSFGDEPLERFIPPSRQTAGIFACRMLDCKVSLPICRILNHIRYEHPNHLIELENDLSTDGYQGHWKVRSESFRKTIFMKKSGIFFLIVNVLKYKGGFKLTGWVQRVGTNDDGKDFRFTLKIKIGGMLGVYSALVYGAQSDMLYIIKREHCLCFQTPEPNANMEISLEMSRYFGPKDVRRIRDTNVILVAEARPRRTRNRNRGRRN